MNTQKRGETNRNPSLTSPCQMHEDTLPPKRQNTTDQLDHILHQTCKTYHQKFEEVFYENIHYSQCPCYAEGERGSCKVILGGLPAGKEDFDHIQQCISFGCAHIYLALQHQTSSLRRGEGRDMSHSAILSCKGIRHVAKFSWNQTRPKVGLELDTS